MSNLIKRGSTRLSDETMDDDPDDKDDNKRKSRNLSEKKRRDQFNMLINELSSMVSTNSRKMDKSTVLKSTISFLKNHNEISVRSRAHEIQENWKPSFLSNEEFTHLILEALDGFIMVFSCTGRIFYTSESITSLLGHLPSDLLNKTIYDMVYEEDQSSLYNVLVNPNNCVDSMHSSDTKENQVSFSCHIKRGGLDFREEVTYELVQFVGYFRTDVDPSEVDNLISSSRFSNFSGDTDTRLVFVGTGRLQTPLLIREMSVVDSTKCEFTSRHSLEWKFLFLDHRAPPIIGYLPFEVLGTSGYDYYHVDDLEKVVTCHEALMQKGEGTSCHYRFLTKGQQWIWLQTRFYITYHQWNSKPEFIVCTHRVISYIDVMKQLRKGMENDTARDGASLEDTHSKQPASQNEATSLTSSDPQPSAVDKNCEKVDQSTQDSQQDVQQLEQPTQQQQLELPIQQQLEQQGQQQPEQQVQQQQQTDEQVQQPEHQGPTQSEPQVQEPEQQVLLRPIQKTLQQLELQQSDLQILEQPELQQSDLQILEQPELQQSDLQILEQPDQQSPLQSQLQTPQQPQTQQKPLQQSQHQSRLQPLQQPQQKPLQKPLQKPRQQSEQDVQQQPRPLTRLRHSQRPSQRHLHRHTREKHQQDQKHHSQPSLPSPKQDSQQEQNQQVSQSTSSQPTLQQASQSGLAASPWSSKSSDIRSPTASASGLKGRRSRHDVPGADSASLSSDSPGSRQSQVTNHSMRSDARVHSLDKPLLTMLPPQQVTPSTATFLEPPQQFVAAIPVQPVLAASLPGTTAVVTTLPATELVRQPIVMTTAQSQIQEQLQKKHEELQQLIVQQQEELRRVSEQLLMARYGLLPPVQLNVTLPYSTGTVSSTTNPLGHETLASPNMPVTISSDLLNNLSPIARHHQTTSIVIEPHQVNRQHHTSEDVIPFPLSQQQAQLLFSSNSTHHHHHHQ